MRFALYIAFVAGPIQVWGTAYHCAQVFTSPDDRTKENYCVKVNSGNPSFPTSGSWANNDMHCEQSCQSTDICTTPVYVKAPSYTGLPKEALTAGECKSVSDLFNKDKPAQMFAYKGCSSYVRGPYGQVYLCSPSYEYSVANDKRKCSYVFNQFGVSLLGDACITPAQIQEPKNFVGEIKIQYKHPDVTISCGGVKYRESVDSLQSKLSGLIVNRDSSSSSFGVFGQLRRSVGISDYDALEGDASGLYKYDKAIAAEVCNRLKWMKDHMN